MKLAFTLFLALFVFMANPSFAQLSNQEMKVAYVDKVSKDKQIKKEITAELKKINKAISTIKKEIKNNQKSTSKVKSEIKKLEEQQNKIETQLKKELDNFNQATTSILRLSQIPEEMIILEDTLNMQQKRDGVLSIFKKQLNHDIVESKKSLTTLIANSEEQKLKRSTLENITKTLVAKKRSLNELRKEQKLVLRLPREIRLSMEKDALLLAQNLNLKKFLKNVKKVDLVAKTTIVKNQKQPVSGKIVEKFHAKDRITGVPVQGVTIESTPRAKIRSMHDGRVIYSGVFREYGHLVILEHQSGAHSLYAGFAKAIIEIGDYVNAGDLMGFLPSEEEPSFYYEVRIDNNAVEPTAWFTKDLNILK